MKFLLLTLFFSLVFCNVYVKLDVNTIDGTFILNVEGQDMFQSKAPEFLGKALTHVKTFSSQGKDSNGNFNATLSNWKNDDGQTFRTYILKYGGNVLKFGQIFLEASNGLSTNLSSKAPIISCFPCFKVLQNDLGYLVYKQQMTGDIPHLGKFSDSVEENGYDVGPLAFFNSNASVVALFSAANEFMNHQTTIKNGNINFGIRGQVTSLPANYEVRTILTINAGINDVFAQWGKFLRTEYGKTRHQSESDFTCNYLGYSTDNGAWYYYKTEDGKNYEDTLIDIAKNAKSVGLPYRHVLLDSWWYYQGPSGAVTNWTPRPDIFPHGMQYVHNATGWQIMAHNRFWSNESVYAKQNGGAFDGWIMDGFSSVPTTDEFWDFLMEQSARWGIVVYEQDWLHNEFENVAELRQSPTLARQWLLQMGRAASNHGLTIQYCMSWARHVLQSLEIPSVTQARISGDYHPGNNQWITGLTAIYTDAIAIRGSKDNYWTNTTEKGRYGNDTESRPELQTVSSILTRGPVYISDKIGYTNVPLVMKTCRMDGKLLQPTRPAMNIDKNILAKAGFNDLKGEIWKAKSVLGPYTFYHVLVADAAANSLSKDDLSLESDVEYIYTENQNPSNYQPFDGLKWNYVHQINFKLFHIFPITEDGEMVFLGESDKYVPVSPDRFSSLAYLSGCGFHFNVKGSLGEQITVLCMKKTSGKNESWDLIKVDIKFDNDVVSGVCG